MPPYNITFISPVTLPLINNNRLLLSVTLQSTLTGANVKTRGVGRDPDKAPPTEGDALADWWKQTDSRATYRQR